jgi:integrase-like protein
MTQLRKRMLEELQRRNYSPTTIRCYLRVVEDFARYFGRRPDHLTEEHMREYHLHLLHKRKLTPKTVGLHIAALRFVFVKNASASRCASRSSLSQGARAHADGIEPGRSVSAHRLCKESFELHDACRTPLILIERLTAAQLFWRLSTRAFSDSS